MKEIKEYTVFLSCPSDLTEDRVLAEQIIDDYSKKHAPDKVIFKTVHIDTVASKMGKAAQDYINEQINEYDIYIGLMGERFGSPTANFGSGTEEEFHKAFEKFKSDEDLHISFLFKDVNFSNPSSVQLEQYQKVRQFQDSIQDSGLYRPYNNNEALDREISKILALFLEEREEEHQNPQYSLITEVASDDIFQIDEDFFNDTLNSIDANISNGYKEHISLSDVYVPLDLAVINNPADDTEEKIEEIINSSHIDHYKNQDAVKLFVVGDESAGKTAFCRRTFFNYHRVGIIPILIDGAQIKSSSPDRLEKLIEKSFSQQYKPEAWGAYKALSTKRKLIIIDNLDSSSLNTKHKLVSLSRIEKLCAHIAVTADQLFLFNAFLTVPEEYNFLNKYEKYEIQYIGHKLRDDLTKKWLLAGGDHRFEEEELYSRINQYGKTVEAILGSNYVPRRPFVILVLLQGIHCGTESSDLTHSSFVRYYQFLIDETLLKRVPKEKVDLYYAFLPEIAYLIFKNGNDSFSKEELTALIEEYASRKAIDSHDLINVKSHLITLGMLELDEESYRFKHCYTYFYFLGQYLAENLNNPEISSQVVDTCNKIHLRKNANIIIFLSYHTRDPLIIGTLLEKAESMFSEEDVFDFGKANTSKINQLVSEAPKIIVQHGKEVAERDQALKSKDDLDRKYGTGSDQDLNVLDFGEQIILAFRTIEIIGQLLKNHAFKLDAGPKQEMYTKAANLSMRSLNALVDHLLDPDQLMEFIDESDQAQITEDEAKKVVFSLAHLMITCFIKATAHFTGAEMLKKTYESVAEESNNKAFRLVNLSIGLDHYQEAPLAELKRIANDCKTDFLAMSALRSIVQGWFKMRPMADIDKKQMICDAVGISLKKQRLRDKKAKAVS